MLEAKKLLHFPLFIIFLISCIGRDGVENPGDISEVQIAIKGYEYPLDSLEAPKTVVAGKPKVIRALKPKVTLGKPLPMQGKQPVQIPALSPKILLVGQDGLAQPRQVASSGVAFPATLPEIVISKNAVSKDINPQGFSTYSTVQGLKSNQIRCMLQDKAGNIWFSNEEGVTRYDGKYLSHFVISNGLNQNNIVLSMMEDQAGSLWFGTFGYGVYCFDGKDFTQYTEKEGLSNNIVNDIIQDKKGDYWMATSGGGVTRFDGKVFTHYTTKEGLAGNQVRTLFQDKAGDIWMGTFGQGISRFNGKGFTNYTVREGFPATHLASILQDLDGSMWFGSYSNGLIKYDGKFFTQYTTDQGLANNTILCMIQEENGSLWLGSSGGGISLFDGKVFRNFTESDGLPNGYIRCSLIGQSGNLWFGARDGGLVSYKKNLFTHYSEKEGVAGNRVYGILQDRKDNLWFSSFGGGITKYNGTEFHTYSLKETYLNSFVYAILESKKGDIWLGSDGGGITRFDGENFTQYKQEEGLCSNSIRCIMEDRDENLWVGSYGGGVSKFDGKTFVNYNSQSGLGSDKILAIVQDKNGLIWFATDNGGIVCFDGKIFTRYSVNEGLNGNSFTSILEDYQGDMWFGSFGGGLLRFNGKYFILYNKSDGLSSDIITSLRQDRRGNLWIGTKMGPNILHADKLKLKPGSPNSNIFKSFTYDDGFLGIGCNLNAQLEDKNGVIWFGSSNRLTAIKPNEEVPDTVAPNILLTNIQLFNESIPWSNIDPRKDTTIILGNSVQIHHLQFSDISKWYFLPEDLSLYHDNNFLAFHYIGISQSQTSKIRYEYWLEGLDRNWSSPTDHTEVAYGNLNPGKYNFKVRAMNAEGIWSKECSFAFSIRPPWWETWWFYSLAFLTVVLIILGYIRIRVYQHIAQKKLLSKIIDEQTHELKDKNRELENMNNELIISNSEKDKFFSIIAHDVRGPLGTFHLFTELMAENLETYEPKEIRLMANSMHESASSLFKLLENLLIWARMQRGLIQFSPEQLNTIEILNNAVETNLQTAKNKSIAIIVDISDSLEIFADKNMAESILRNLISNAVKFTPRGGKVTISAEKKDDSVILFSVADTGIGMDQNALNDLFKIDIHNKRKGTEGESSAGLGLLLCSDFVKKLNGRIWAESEVGKGSTFYFTIPSVS